MSNPLLKSVTLQGFLSYGPDATTIDLRSLNVFIGANGSGKSNLIEALAVMRAAPGDLPVPVREGGLVRDWLWKGGEEREAKSAILEVLFSEGAIPAGKVRTPPIRHRLEFGTRGDQFVVLDERIENELARPHQPKPFFYFGYENGQPTLNVGTNVRRLQRESIDPTQSILSQRRDPDTYPELAGIADRLSKVLLYRSWTFGPKSIVRAACSPNAVQHVLREELDNLPMRLQAIQRSPTAKKRLLALISEVAPGFTDLEAIPEGGALQLYLTEGTWNVPARRLSDGTLRFLCLAAILLDPAAASLIVIEEPELGLHPDLMPVIRDMLVEASAKTQVIVTTHSTVLADAFTDHADSVVVCEKHDGSTRLERLAQADIDRWKADGGLGSVWTSGRIGGTRW